jgi:tRNA (guanosine-2'-O-)-methyltransferase
MEISSDFECATPNRIRNMIQTKEKLLKTFICVIENPKLLENVSSIIRNANVFGLEKIYIIDGNNLFKGKDWNNLRYDKMLNALSVSAIRWTWIKIFKTTEECIEHLKKKNFTIAVTSPHCKGKKNIQIKDGVFTNKRLSVWFGNESKGVTEQVINVSDYCIQIPVYGLIESLNLAQSTGIVMYEISNQRRNFKK